MHPSSSVHAQCTVCIVHTAYSASPLNTLRHPYLGFSKHTARGIVCVHEICICAILRFQAQQTAIPVFFVVGTPERKAIAGSKSFHRKDS